MTCPILKENVKIAVETINDPENLFWPSSRLIAVIGIKVKPNKLAENKKVNSLLLKTENNTPIPIIEHAKKSDKSFPILWPNQFQKKTEGIPDIPTINQIYGSVFSKPEVVLAMVEINVPKATYPKPYKQ